MGKQEILESSVITRRNFIKAVSASVILTPLLGFGIDVLGEEHGTFCTAINCIDGRVQEPVYDYMKNTCNVSYVDMITAPGPDGIISRGDTMCQYIKSAVLISVEKHASKTVAIVGHHDCKGNPVSKEGHWRDIRDSVNKIQSWSLPVNVIGLWVNENWKVELVS